MIKCKLPIFSDFRNDKKKKCMNENSQPLRTKRDTTSHYNDNNSTINIIVCVLTAVSIIRIYTYTYNLFIIFPIYVV